MKQPSTKILLCKLIDYAGLFPPANLSMRETVRNYAAYRESQDAWALGRLIIPLTRLAEFEAALNELPFTETYISTWHLSALGGDDWQTDLERIAEFNQGENRIAPHRSCSIDALEYKITTVDEVRDFARQYNVNKGMLSDRDFPNKTITSSIEIFLELPHLNASDSFVEAIADAGVCAKVRTGGVSAEMFPSPGDLAHFIHLCARRGVAFKATAGLHHPVRNEYSLTYEPESLKATMHGFLNVFLTATFAREHIFEKTLISILEETNSSNFVFDESGVTWRRHRLNLQQLKNARGDCAVSFGSCSFTEPLDELRALDLL